MLAEINYYCQKFAIKAVPLILFKEYSPFWSETLFYETCFLGTSGRSVSQTAAAMSQQVRQEAGDSSRRGTYYIFNYFVGRSSNYRPLKRGDSIIVY